MQEPYYLAYEKRYKTVFETGAHRWGHAPDDAILYETLKKWVCANDLEGKSIIEFACGEGACGVILSELGCKYHGVDISPTVVQRAKVALRDYQNASVDVFDMVIDTVTEKYDAALDCMGFHMLVTDNDRNRYLKNAYNALNVGAPMLFFRQSYRNENHIEAAYKGIVHSFDEWKAISGIDYDTPTLRKTNMGNGNVEMLIPLVPARANDRDGYIKEMEQAGFVVEEFMEMDESSAILYSASIFVRKGFDLRIAP